ncbi:RING finger protein 112 [Amia ocellicauda]|uniref:RING finger protein 112 n=1 Tax=Amia ocellicauda TaxID=2972642 RepID=UPI0034643090
MGNSPSIPERSTSIQFLLQEEQDNYLRAEPQCSICLGVFTDPVTIECGHHFCRACIVTFWVDRELTCPQCRWLCDREKTVSKQDIPFDCDTPGQPLQLVGFNDISGSMQLHEDVLQTCFLRPDVKDTPVCVVSVIGERRKGKSFLLNYILRKLSKMEHVNGSWMGEDEPLEGFEWRPGADSTTKGIYIWSRPLFVERLEGNIAVFLVDTEGSVDILRDSEVSVKLSALSVFLSSHLIFNVHTNIKKTDLDYLEMLYLMAENGKNAFDFKQFQGFDFLVRDWTYTMDLGHAEGARQLEIIIQQLETSKTNPKALSILKEENPQCYLMPFPGRRMLKSEQGTVQDMDEEFRDCLREYVDHIAESLETSQSSVTGGTLAEKFKIVADSILNSKYRISNQLELLDAIITTQAEQEFKTFLEEQNKVMLDPPKKMKARVEVKTAELCERLREEVNKQALEDFETWVLGQQEEFLKIYDIKFGIVVACMVTVPVLSLAGGVAGGVIAGGAVAAEAGVIAAGTAIGTTAGVGVGSVATAVATAMYKRIKSFKERDHSGE